MMSDSNIRAHRDSTTDKQSSSIWDDHYRHNTPLRQYRPYTAHHYYYIANYVRGGEEQPKLMYYSYYDYYIIIIIIIINNNNNNNISQWKLPMFCAFDEMLMVGCRYLACLLEKIDEVALLRSNGVNYIEVRRQYPGMTTTIGRD